MAGCAEEDASADAFSRRTFFVDPVADVLASAEGPAGGASWLSSSITSALRLGGIVGKGIYSIRLSVVASTPRSTSGEVDIDMALLFYITVAVSVCFGDFP